MACKLTLVLRLLGKKRFTFRGCGWSQIYRVDDWTQHDRVWIGLINVLFKKMLGQHYLDYTHIPGRGTKVSDVSDPRDDFSYNHEQWEASYEAKMVASENSVRCRIKLNNDPVCDDQVDIDYANDFTSSGNSGIAILSDDCRRVSGDSKGQAMGKKSS